MFIFEEFFKVKKNIFLFLGMWFLVLDIFIFLYYVNVENDSFIKIV